MNDQAEEDPPHSPFGDLHQGHGQDFPGAMRCFSATNREGDRTVVGGSVPRAPSYEARLGLAL
jgi:hypothetical protein